MTVIGKLTMNNTLSDRTGIWFINVNNGYHEIIMDIINLDVEAQTNN